MSLLGNLRLVDLFLERVDDRRIGIREEAIAGLLFDGLDAAAILGPVAGVAIGVIGHHHRDHAGVVVDPLDRIGLAGVAIDDQDHLPGLGGDDDLFVGDLF